MNRKKTGLGMGLETLFKLSNQEDDCPALDRVQSFSLRSQAGRIELSMQADPAPENALDFLRVLLTMLAPAMDAYEQGLALYDDGHLEAAQKKMAFAISRFDRCADFHYAMGLILDGLGEADASVGAFERAIALNPKDADAWVNLGAGWYAQGRLEDALAALQKAITIDPEHPVARENWKVLRP